MPPSPASRCSSGRELPGKNHRRGHSIEYGILFREKDDDLALFSEMENKEKESFLLQSSDDFEDAFSSKLKHFSEFSIPVQGESSRLLNADRDKNDYDWLLTPPDTPLFPSLDDELPSASATSRGRPRGQISLSRSSTMEKSHRSSKGSASPNRLSISPRSGSMQQMRGRTSSARQPSPTTALRPATPVGRTSPSPSKPARPASRSSTPNSRRMSTGSNTMAAPAIRGTSPARSSRGNSASPKIKAWQSNIPGFSLDAPPNLRTSLADRPASYVRGSSPASRNGRESVSRHSRQSVSPIASRSVSSSYSHERDRFSSHSKGSVASSGDDDLDSLQSIPLGGSDRPVSKRASLSPNNKTLRSSKLLSPSSAPKRPFESALRQMDQHKSHRNMFRPLVSSVPSTGLYTGKDSSSYHHIILRHSTATIGSGASSARVTGFMQDTKGSELLHDSHSGSGTFLYPNDKHEEFATLGTTDSLSEGSRGGKHGSSLTRIFGGPNQGNTVECDSGATEEVNHRTVDVEINSALPVVDVSEGVDLENLEICSRCGRHYNVTDAVENEISLCRDCREMETALLETTTVLAENSPYQSMDIVEERMSLVEMNSKMNMPESLQQPVVEIEQGTSETQEIKQGQHSYEEEQKYLQESIVSENLIEGGGEKHNHQLEILPSSDCDKLNRDTDGIDTLLSNKHCDLKVDSSENSNNASLIKRSSSMKSPTTHAKNFNVSVRSSEDFSFSRERSDSLRSSTEHATASASSSSDYGSFILKGNHVRRPSGNTPDVGSHRYDINSKSLSTVSSSSGLSSHACQAPSVMLRDSSEVFADGMPCNDDGTCDESQSKIQDSGNKESDETNSAFGDSCRSIGISTLELSAEVVGIVAESNLVASLDNNDNKCLHEDGDDDLAKTVICSTESGESPVHVKRISELEASPFTSDSLEDHFTLQNSADEENKGKEISDHGSSGSASEIELEPPCSEVHDGLQESECNINEDEACSDLCSSEKNVTLERNSSAPANGCLDESTVLVECHGGREPKSLTLEEATDTILFCSSIVHDLAYRAATIAMEKQDNVPIEDTRPTVMILGKSNTERRGRTRSGTKARRGSKSAKARQKEMETDVNASSPMENDENAGEATIRNVEIVDKGDSLKPPPKLESKCNCSIM